MVSTILHLEDDADLRELVQLLFESFGFRGKHVSAGTLAAAIKVLDDMAREAGNLDLIIVDMNLPDGTGLDLVRYVRASPAWKYTPMVILSGDVDPTKVQRAYALGADAYVDKASPGRLLADVVTTLYTHRTIIDLLSAMSIEGLALSIDHLFTGMPEAMAAARAFLINMIGDVARWIDANTDDVALRERTVQLQATATAAFARVAAPTA